MGPGPTLITTTRLGVRPLGVRGEPLHNTHAQLRQVIRRRLGDGPADLLAEPQMRESGDGIDWYAGWSGPVRRLSDLAPQEREAALGKISGDLAAVDTLGDELGASESSEEARLVGRSLKLATRRPSDDFVYVVGDRPAIVAWGYEADAAGSLLGAALPTVPVLPPPPSAVFASVPALPLAARVGWAPWLRALIFGLLLLLLLLMASWLLRACMPVPPELSIAMRETPAPPAPEAPPDPTPILKAALDDFQGDEKKLRAELATLADDLKKKIDDCKPPEPPKVEPPKIVQAPPRTPPPPPRPQAAVEPPKPQAAVEPPRPPPPSAPPTSRPPPGQLPCDWSGDSGGEGVTRNKHYLGDKPGFVTINYNLYVRPDEVKVMYRGQQIAGTRGVRSGRGGFGFDWNPVGGDNSVDVIVIGEMLGTRWQYAMACPRR